MKIFYVGLFILLLVACSPWAKVSAEANLPTLREFNDHNQLQMDKTLPDFGIAPELTTTVWINSSTPLRLEDLKGKVILLEMWTFGCSNCRNVIPSLKDWHAKYAQEGLVIIGNHYPEFDQEHDLKNLTDAVQKLGILYPVTQDNDGKTWQSYNNVYWPTLYIIDKNGHIRYKHIGEGSYQKTEDAIRFLLEEN